MVPGELFLFPKNRPIYFFFLIGIFKIEKNHFIMIGMLHHPVIFGYGFVIKKLAKALFFIDIKEVIDHRKKMRFPPAPRSQVDGFIIVFSCIFYYPQKACFVYITIKYCQVRIVLTGRNLKMLLRQFGLFFPGPDGKLFFNHTHIISDIRKYFKKGAFPFPLDFPRLARPFPNLRSRSPGCGAIPQLAQSFLLFSHSPLRFD